MDLSKRLNGQTERVLQHYEDFGCFKTKQWMQRELGVVVGTEKLARWANERLGDTVQAPRFRSYGGTGTNDPFDFFMEKLSDYLAKTKTKIEAQDEKIRILEGQLDYYQSRNRDISPELVEMGRMIGVEA